MGVSSRRWALKRESYENRSAVSVHVGQSDHRGQLNVIMSETDTTAKVAIILQYKIIHAYLVQVLMTLNDHSTPKVHHFTCTSCFLETAV